MVIWREREREWSETSLHCIEHSLRRLSFDLCSLCSLCLFFCRARRLTLIHIRILIHIQFFIVVAFVAFCFATRYVSCFANQQPHTLPLPLSLLLSLSPSAVQWKWKEKANRKWASEYCYCWGDEEREEEGKGERVGERGRMAVREQRASVFDCQSHAI